MSDVELKRKIDKIRECTANVRELRKPSLIPLRRPHSSQAELNARRNANQRVRQCCFGFR